MALTLDACQVRDGSGRVCGKTQCAHNVLVTQERSFYSPSVWALVEAAKKDTLLLDIFPEIQEIRDRHAEINADYADGKLTAFQRHKLKNEAAMLIFRGMESRERIIQLRREKLTHTQLRQIFRDLFAVVQREVRDPVLRANIGRRMRSLIRPGRALPEELEQTTKGAPSGDGGLAEQIEHRANSGMPSGNTDIEG